MFGQRTRNRRESMPSHFPLADLHRQRGDDQSNVAEDRQKKAWPLETRRPRHSHPGAQGRRVAGAHASLLTNQFSSVPAAGTDKASAARYALQRYVFLSISHSLFNLPLLFSCPITTDNTEAVVPSFEPVQRSVLNIPSFSVCSPQLWYRTPDAATDGRGGIFGGFARGHM